MRQALVIILDRKFFEERLAAHYWEQPAAVQEGFLRAYRQPVPAADGERRNAISTVVAGMDDMELAVMSEAVAMMQARGPAA